MNQWILQSIENYINENATDEMIARLRTKYSTQERTEQLNLIDTDDARAFLTNRKLAWDEKGDRGCN